MRKSIFIIPFLTCGLFLIFTSFKIKRGSKTLPPGTVRVTENFFIDETEISNFSWQEFEIWTKNKYGANSAEHIATLPDTLTWRDNLACNEPYVQYYYRHPAYKDYPVIGISYEQAQAYCKWRTERVKEYYAIRYKKNWNIEYRLPTKEEWERIASSELYVFNNKGRNEKKQLTFNHHAEPLDTSEYAWYNGDHADVTAPVNSYWKNRFGVYNMIGNVAEMVQEKGISKGGSWRHKLEQCRPGKDLMYNAPKAWIGFRCVCVMQNS